MPLVFLRFYVNYDKAVEVLMANHPNLRSIVEKETDHSVLPAAPWKDDQLYIVDTTRAGGILFGLLVPADDPAANTESEQETTPCLETS